jgi:hypothetical protein
MANLQGRSYLIDARNAIDAIDAIDTTNELQRGEIAPALYLAEPTRTFSFGRHRS